MSLFRIFACVAGVLALTEPGAAQTNPKPAEDPHAHHVLAGVSTINGEVPPGVVRGLQDVTVLLDTITSRGDRLLVVRGTRLAGTRVGIHVHEYGGHTCVLSGTVTDFVEGKPVSVQPAGTCYYMPADTPMSAANLGAEDAVLVDTFQLPPDAATITIVEPGVTP